MPAFSTTAINRNPKAAVIDDGFCLNQIPPFAMSALRYNLGNFFVATVIFFLFAVFSYKTHNKVLFINTLALMLIVVIARTGNLNPIRWINPAKSELGLDWVELAK